MRNVILTQKLLILQLRNLTGTRQLLSTRLRKQLISFHTLNPEKFMFQTVSHIVAIVMKLIKCIKGKMTTSANLNQDKTFSLNFKVTEDEISDGEEYFFKKAADEVKHFNKKPLYETISSYRKRWHTIVHRWNLAIRKHHCCW